MGIWGYGLYQNDTSLDVKKDFEELYKSGKSVQVITDDLMNEYRGIMGDADEEPLFWMALADIQWKYGVLLPYVKEKALFWIEKDSTAYENQVQIVGMRNEEERKRILNDLKLNLLSPQPPIKKITKKKIYECQWNLWDVFAYQLESDLSKDEGLYGRYFLIQKVDEVTWYPGHIVPIVYVKITKDSKLPTNIEEFNKLEYIQTDCTKYENRFFPIDMSRPQEDIAEKSKLNYKVDEYGFLPVFRIKLLNISKSVIPKKLIHIGNYPDIVFPENEFIPHSNINIQPVYWKKYGETFETKMIKCYCNHNLKRLSIYK